MNRPIRLFWIGLWTGSISFSVTAYLSDFVKKDMAVIVGRDFSNMWTSGRMALESHAYRSFNLDSHRLALNEQLGVLTLQNFSYPPPTLFLNVPFALFPYYVALALWIIFGLTLFALSARPFLPKGFPAWLAAATPAAGFCVWGGQYGLVLGALWLWVFALIERRPVAAGIIAGLMTFKPHLGLLVAVILLRNWRAGAAAIATTAALIFSSALIFGTATWFGFINETIGVQAEVLTRNSNDFYFHLMVGAYTGFGKGPIGVTAQLFFTAFAIAKLWGIRKLPARDLAFAFSTGTFLIIPYGFNYDMTVTCLGFAVLLYRHWSNLSRNEVIVATVCFACPVLTVFHVTLAPIALAFGLDLQCRMLRQSPATGDQRVQRESDPSNVSAMAAV